MPIYFEHEQSVKLSVTCLEQNLTVLFWEWNMLKNPKNSIYVFLPLSRSEGTSSTKLFQLKSPIQFTIKKELKPPVVSTDDVLSRTAAVNTAAIEMPVSWPLKHLH